MVGTSLAENFANLFATTLQYISFFALGLILLTFRRALVGERLEQWRALRDLCANSLLTDEEYKHVWFSSSSGDFSVKSFYAAMQSASVIPSKFW